MKKLLVLLVAVCLMASISVGCTQPTLEKTEETVSGTVDEEVVLNFLTWRSEDVEVYKKINEIFESENPGIKINMDTKTANEEEYYAVLKTKLSSKNDSVDIFAIHPGQHLNEVAPTGKMLDLAEAGIADYYQDQYISMIEMEGKVYGVPQGLTQLLAFYNKGMFNDLGLKVPKTWTEMQNVIKVLKDNGKETMVAGLGEKWVYDILIYPWFVAYNQDNPKVLLELEQGTIKWTDPGVRGVYEDMQKAGEIGLFQSGAEGTKYEQSLSMFAQGNSGMLLTGSWSVGGLITQAPDIEQGCFIVPTSKDVCAVTSDLAQLYSINADSNNLEAAIKYLTFLSTPAMQQLYADETIQPTAAKNVILDKPALQEINELLSSEDVVLAEGPHLICTDAEFLVLTEVAAARAFMGEDIDTILADCEKEAALLREK